MLASSTQSRQNSELMESFATMTKNLENLSSSVKLNASSSANQTKQAQQQQLLLTGQGQFATTSAIANGVIPTQALIMPAKGSKNYLLNNETQSDTSKLKPQKLNEISLAKNMHHQLQTNQIITVQGQTQSTPKSVNITVSYGNDPQHILGSFNTHLLDYHYQAGQRKFVFVLPKDLQDSKVGLNKKYYVEVKMSFLGSFSNNNF